MELLFSIIILLHLHYLYFLNRVRRGLGNVEHNTHKLEALPNVSVIVPFRNEEKVIGVCVKSLERQLYPKEKYEIIYVDDFSEDKSLSVIRENSSNTVTILSTSNSLGGSKKRAMALGIEHAAGDIIISTDADCVHNEKWVQTLVSCMDSATGFLSAPVKFKNGDSLWQKIQQLEFAGLVLTGGGLIGSGSPTICNGANIAFKKEAFQKVDGYTSDVHLASGDDEFLMRKISRAGYGVKFLLAPDAVVETIGNANLGDFLEQRKRWASKSLFYEEKSLIVKLSLIFFYYLSFILLFGLVFINPGVFYFLLISVCFKIFIEYSVLIKGVGVLYKKIELVPFIVAQLFHVPYILYSSISGALGNFEWKGRKVKR